MAVNLPGPLASAVSGKIGDIVFLRGQGGATIRSLGTWIQPNTDLQLEVRSILTTLSAAWSGTLTVTQREGWRSYAGANPRPNRWGHLNQTSGYLAFCRHNFHAYRHAAALQFPNAPTAQPLHTPIVTMKVQQAGALLLTGATTPDCAGLYHPKGSYQGKARWQRTDGAWSIWTTPPFTAYYLSAIPGTVGNYWWMTNGPPTGIYDWHAQATGTATAAWSYDGSLAKVTFPPVNYPSPSQTLQVYTYSGTPLRQGRTFYNGPWSILSTFAPPVPATAASTWLRWTWPTKAVGDPYAWTADGTDTARAYAIIQDMLTGAISTKHTLTPTFGSLTPW